MGELHEVIKAASLKTQSNFAEHSIVLQSPESPSATLTHHSLTVSFSSDFSGARQ
jgi:hypothetical protein